ncbi:MAG: hypothetical protein ABIB65_03755 [Candidatus Margulisiibacteriota bacterium]
MHYLVDRVVHHCLAVKGQVYVGRGIDPFVHAGHRIHLFFAQVILHGALEAEVNVRPQLSPAGIPVLYGFNKGDPGFGCQVVGFGLGDVAGKAPYIPANGRADLAVVLFQDLVGLFQELIAHYPYYLVFNILFSGHFYLRFLKSWSTALINSFSDSSGFLRFLENLRAVSLVNLKKR